MVLILFTFSMGEEKKICVRKETEQLVNVNEQFKKFI